MARNEKTQTVVKKKPFRWLVRLLVVLAALIAACAAGYYFTRQNVLRYVPGHFTLFLQVPSLKTAYTQWIDLEAADAVLADPKFAGIRKPFRQFKGMGISRSWILKEALDVEASIVMVPGQAPLLAFDLGWRSFLTRFLPLLPQKWVPLKDVTELVRDTHTLFVYEKTTTNGTTGPFYIAFVHNLALVSSSPDMLVKALETRQNGTSLADRKDNELLDALRKSDPKSIRIIADTAELIRTGLPQTMADRVLSVADFQKETVVSFKLDSEEIELSTRFRIGSKQPPFDRVLSFQRLPVASLASMPDNTYLYTVYNLTELKDALEAYSYFVPAGVSTVAKAEEATRALLGMGMDELLFNWAGNEISAAFFDGRPEPVFSLSVKDPEALKKMLSKLQQSAFLDTDESLVYNGVRLGRITLPDFLSGVVSMFGFRLDMPYYLREDRQIFFSTDPDALAMVANKRQSKELLLREPSFAKLSQPIAKDSALFLYYDMEKTTPFFLQQAGTVRDVLRIYNRGVLALQIKPDSMTLVLSARKSRQTGASLFPGFPKALPGGIDTSFVIAQSADRLPVAVYVNTSNQAVFFPLLGGSNTFLSVEPHTRFAVESTGMVYGFSPEGTLYRVSTEGEMKSPYPVITACKESFFPVPLFGSIALYSPADRKILNYGPSGDAQAWGPALDSVLREPPSAGISYAAFAPRSFEGPVYLTDPSGKPLPGWPLKTGGISTVPPLLFKDGGEIRVAVLLQKGELHLYNIEGRPVEHFPVNLQGSFATAPAACRSEGKTYIAALANDGTLVLVSTEGQVAFSRRMNGLNAKETVITVLDLDRDGNDEFFLTGGRNTMEGLSAKLADLEGFPAAGAFPPALVDMNGDGRMEIATAGLDGKIYVYQYRK